MKHLGKFALIITTNGQKLDFKKYLSALETYWDFFCPQDQHLFVLSLSLL